MAQQEENPDIQWAMDILTPAPDYELNFFSKNQHYLFFGIISQVMVYFSNFYNQRPAAASIHRYPLAFAGGMVIGHFLKKDKEKREGFRDAILKDYIRKHPEDFKKPVLRTYNDLFHPWVPYR